MFDCIACLVPSYNEINFYICLVCFYKQSNNAVTSGNGVDQQVASHDQDSTVDMDTNLDSSPFLGFDVPFQTKPIRVLSLFDGVSSGNIFFNKYVLEQVIHICLI